jgi:hypothetical protein
MRATILFGVFLCVGIFVWGTGAHAEGFCSALEWRPSMPGAEAALPACRAVGADWEHFEFMLPPGVPGFIPQRPTAPGAG